MREIILFISFATILIISSGCSGSKQYYLDPEYQEQKLSTTLLILPVQRDWFTQFYEHNFGYVSGRDKLAFYSLLNPIFSENAAATVFLPDATKKYDESNFRISQLKLGESYLKTVVPTKDADFVESGSRPTFVLLLDQYYFQKRRSTGRVSTYAGHEGDSGTQQLYFHTNYVYWDNIKKKPVAWGKSESKITITKEATLPKYSELLTTAMQKIISNGPISSY